MIVNPIQWTLATQIAEATTTDPVLLGCQEEITYVHCKEITHDEFNWKKNELRALNQFDTERETKKKMMKVMKRDM